MLNSTKDMDKNSPVLVTGANGYVASWLVKKLLDEGCTVHAAVRDIGNKQKVSHLLELAKKSKGKLITFNSDLFIEGSYKEAMQGCTIVFHTASPFRLDINDPQKELIDPALIGTQNVLNTARETQSVMRVVLTSSCAAIYTDASECAQYENNELTEEIWNTTASLNYQPYSYSKTIAEKKAWDLYRQQNQWELVVINPSFVLGPFLNASFTTSESFNILKQLGDGTFKQGVPKMGIGVVDVRDLAQAHFNAAFQANARGRYIANAHNTSFLEIAQNLFPKFGDKYPIPKKAAPKWLIWLLGPLLNKALTRKFVINNVNHIFKANNSKIKQDLGLEFRPLKDTLEDAFQSLVNAKVVLPSK